MNERATGQESWVWSMAKAISMVVEGEMERPVWLVFLLSSLLDVISFGLSLGAQSRRNKVDWEFDEDGNFWYCKYGEDTASGMAAAAFCLLLVGTLVIMGATRCFCCGIPHMPGGSRLCAVLSLTLCWLFFGIAEILLLAGANRNSLRTRTRVVAGAVVPSCEQIRSTIFAAAAAFTFLAWISSQLYYVFEVKSRLDAPTLAFGSSQHHHHPGTPIISSMQLSSGTPPAAPTPTNLHVVGPPFITPHTPHYTPSATPTPSYAYTMP